MLWVAVVTGIYRHEILGVFSSPGRAGAAAINFFAAEKDNYHDVEIVPFTLNKPCELVSNPYGLEILEAEGTKLEPLGRG